MSKYLFLHSAVIALLITIGHQNSIAQNTSPYWSLAGNSNASSTTSKLGTTNAINIRLFTNNIERVQINASNGNVGIGTAAPAQKLHVVGNGYFTGNLGLGTSVPSQKLHVVGNGYFSGNIGIGITAPAYRLHIVTKGIGVYATTSGSPAIYGRSSNSNGYGIEGFGPYVGIYGNATDYGVWGNATNYGVYGTGGSFGVWGVSPYLGVYGYSSNNGYGVYGFSNSSYVSGAYITGVYGAAYTGVKGEGTYGVLGNSSTTNGNGVQGNAYGSSGWGGDFYSQYGFGVVGLTSNSSSYAGFFAGSVYCTASYVSSDKKLKQNITDVNNAMDIINKLQPKYYEYRQDGNYKLMNLPSGKHYGLIAQDVEQVLPGLVKETEFSTGEISSRVAGAEVKEASERRGEPINFKALNYTELIPIMIKAMQEMNKKDEDVIKENESLQLKLEAMEKELNELKAAIKGINTIADLSNSSLEQNTPNPFNSTTIIHYHISEGTANAEMVITEMSGKMIKTISLNSRGTGQITLNSGTLAAGSYNYTLWVDGKLVDSKKMVITK